MSRFVVFILFQVLLVQSVAAQEVLFRMHGSNTIGANLGPALVEAWLLEEGYSEIHRLKQASEEVLIVGRSKAGVEAAVEIKSHGSGTSFKSLKAGLAQVGMSSRPIKEKENNRLKKFGDMNRREAEYVVGLDGIAVIVNAKNPLNQLDKNTIQKIFSGEINRWEQIDKSFSGKINVYARDNKSGTYDTFKALVIGKKRSLLKSALRYESNDQLSDDVASDVSAIGFVGLPSVRRAKALAIAEPGALAKRPELFDVATEDYALARRLYLYVPLINANPHAKSFINFSLSEHGQKIVDTQGFISQNLVLGEMVPNDKFPAEYLKITGEGKRLSLNFRFQKGSIKLDNKALRDIERLVSFLSKKENKQRQVMLFGFSDSSESHPAFSLDLSTFRVDWVSELLVRNGIDPVRVRAYGDAIPVASNEDAGGRHKNRRVEVWLL